MTILEVKVPDIGDFKDVPVIGIEVSPGDTVKAEDPLITLESDKATLEVPSPVAGTVKEIKLKIGDKVAEGTLVLLLETADAGAAAVPVAAGKSPLPPFVEGGNRPRRQLRLPPLTKGGRGFLPPQSPRRPRRWKSRRPSRAEKVNIAPTPVRPYAASRANSASMSRK